MIFTTELNNIKDCIEQQMTIFAKDGYIIQKGQEQRIKGITDNTRYYFYIDFDDGDGNIEFVQRDDVGANAHDVTGSFKIVGRAEGVDIQSVIYGVIACITKDCVSRITSATVDSDLIYREEFDGESITCDMALFKIEFEIEKVMTFDVNCIDITCKDDAC